MPKKNDFSVSGSTKDEVTINFEWHHILLCEIVSKLHKSEVRQNELKLFAFVQLDDSSKLIINYWDSHLLRHKKCWQKNFVWIIWFKKPFDISKKKVENEIWKSKSALVSQHVKYYTDRQKLFTSLNI